jgi:DNA adenine methylase
MKIKAPVPWFGGKRRLAPKIVEALGKHDQYFEPFCGSMAVLFAKTPSRNETVNDLHRDLVNLIRVLSDEGSAVALYERLQRTIVCEALLDDAQGYLDKPWGPFPIGREKLESAYWYFVASWMERNGAAGTKRKNFQLAVRWTLGGGSPTVRFRNAVDSIPVWHERLINVVILCRDAFKIMDRFEDATHTAIYVDPPYPIETRANGGGKGGGGGQYVHEFRHGHGTGSLIDDPDDHARVATILHAYKKARVVVSSYDCPRIRDLYEGWTVVQCPIAKNLSRTKDSLKEAPEILLVNGEV